MESCVEGLNKIIKKKEELAHHRKRRRGGSPKQPVSHLFTEDLESSY